MELLLVHTPTGPHAVSFSTFFEPHQTPAHLIQAGIYASNLAVPLHGGEHRTHSIAMVLRTLLRHPSKREPLTGSSRDLFDSVRLSGETSEQSTPGSRWRALGALCAFQPSSCSSMRASSGTTETAELSASGVGTSHPRGVGTSHPRAKPDARLPDFARLPRPVESHVLPRPAKCSQGKLLFEEPLLLPLAALLASSPSNGAPRDQRERLQAQRASRSGLGLPPSAGLPAPTGHAAAAGGGCDSALLPGTYRRRDVGAWMSVVNDVAAPLQASPQQKEPRRSGQPAPRRIVI